MQLQSTYCPHLGDRAFHSVIQCPGFMMAIDQYEHLPGIQYSSHTDCQSRFRHLVYIIIKKRELAITVSVVSVFILVLELSEEPGSLKAMWPSGPIPPRKRSIPPTSAIVFSYAAHSASGSSAIPLRICTFSFLISIWLKKIVPHKRMVTLRMISRQADIFIHVERNDVLKRHYTCLIKFDQRFVGF